MDEDRDENEGSAQDDNVTKLTIFMISYLDSRSRGNEDS